MLTAISASLSRRRWQSRLANHPVESRHLVDHPAEVCHVAEEVHRLPAHPVEVHHVATHPMEVCRVAEEVRHVADHPVELRGLTVEMRRLADYLADFAADVGSSCLCSLGTVSMYSFFLFSFTRQLESPFTCHQIVSNGSLQATRVQSSAAATPNGRVRIGEDEGVPERKAYTQSLQ